MPDPKDDLGMYTSRFRPLGGVAHTGVGSTKKRIISKVFFTKSR